MYIGYSGIAGENCFLSASDVPITSSSSSAVVTSEKLRGMYTVKINKLHVMV